MPSFVDDLSAAVDAIGVDAVGLVWGVAMAPWESAEQRDAFLSGLTGKVKQNRE